MNILYDHQAFESQNVGGISRYHFELWKGINNNNTVNAKIAIEYSDNIYLKSSNFKTKALYDDYSHFFTRNEFPSKRRLYNLVSNIFNLSSSSIENKKNSIKCLSNEKVDVFHPTFYDTYFMEYLKRTPFVVTIHDMIQENQPQYRINDFTFINKKKLINSASKIIAISEFTKEQILKFNTIPESKIEVIYHGYNQKEHQIRRDQINSKPYFLYVGNRVGYKNFYFIVKALSKILPKYEIDLICIGPQFSLYELEYFKFLKITNHIKCISLIDDDLLHNYYRQSMAFIFPSLEEGFGLPILEALEAECPILLSDIPVFKEVAGNTGIYFNPYSESDFIEKAQHITCNNFDTKQSSTDGLLKLNAYTWTKTSLKTLNVYQQL